MPHDPPPTYTSLQSALPVPGPSSSLYTANNAVNYVSISRKHSHIKESLTVDPSLYIPESLRAPLAEGESERSQKNVRLETVHGHIDAEILLVQDKATLETGSPQRATLQVTSTHGGIKVTIVSSSFSQTILSNRFFHSSLARSSSTTAVHIECKVYERRHATHPSPFFYWSNHSLIPPRGGQDFRTRQTVCHPQ